MQILLVLLLAVAQSDVTEVFSRPEPGVIQDEVAPLQTGTPVPYDEPPLHDGPLFPNEFPNEQDVFMPPDGTDISPLRNFAPPHGAQSGHHPGLPYSRQGGHGAPIAIGPPQPCPGCMPGPQVHFGFEPGVNSFAHGSYSSCPSCQSGLSYQTYQPVGGCPGCRWGCCSLFGCWHLCNCCDACTR